MKPLIDGSLATVAILVCGFLAPGRAYAHPNHPPAPVLSITTDITWSEHIRPIFREKCMNCHSPAGIVTREFDLSTYTGSNELSGARDWVRSIEELVLAKRMPPWGADFRFGSFSNQRFLSQDEIEKIVAWTRGGRPQGPQKGLPTPDEFLKRDWLLGTPDQVYEMPRPHVMAPGVADSQVSFSFPIELASGEKWITAVEFFPGDPTIVHTAMAFIHDPVSDLPYTLDLEVAKKYDLMTGWDETIEIRQKTYASGTRFLGQWVRGDGPVSFPAGTGRLLRDGSTLELKIFYHRNPYDAEYEESQDRSKFGIHFSTEEVQGVSESIVIENKEFVVQADEPNREVRAFATLGEAGHLYAVYPHMGPLGKDLELLALYPDGRSVTLLLISEYEYILNQSYIFEKPLFAPAGTRLELIAHYDNSSENWNNPNDPPKDVAAPEEERLLLYVDYIAADRIYRPKLSP